LNSPHQTRASLLARLSADVDRSVWLEFFEQYAELILGFAKARGLQHSDCEDVLQNVLVSLVHAMKGFRYDPARGSFRGYLLTVVSRAVSQQLRQKRGEGALPEGAQLPVEPADAEAWELEWRRHHVRRAMRIVEREFSEENVQAFTGYVINGLPAQQVADGLGLSIEQVYQAKSRILKRLSTTIEQQRRDEG
jgi:RNA polymerase sigma-70 factor (ECF subfamily)